MSPEILAYLAGIVDGEGYIGLVATRQGTYIPRLCVSMTEPHAINLLHSTFGGNVCFLNPRSKRNAPIYSWAIGSRKLTKPALEALIPYLRVKRELAVLLLSFVDKSNTWIRRSGTYPAEVHDIYSRMKTINGRRYAHAI